MALWRKKTSKPSARLTVESKKLPVDNLEITLLRKNIRSLRLSVTPEGEIRLSAPFHFSDEEALKFVEARLSWINTHRERILRQKALEPTDFSTVLFLGKTYKTLLTHHPIAPRIFFDEENLLHIVLKPGTSNSSIQKVLDAWYKVELKKRIEPLISEWEPIMGVEVISFRFRRMKTRWGTCNVKTHQIVLNTELAKKSFPCIEYILVHEMAHLLERGHGPAFKAVMDRFLPHWRLIRKEMS
jgi:hypothetical protein